MHYKKNRTDATASKLAGAILRGDRAQVNDAKLLCELNHSGSTWIRYDGKEYGDQSVTADNWISHKSIGYSEIGLAAWLKRGRCLAVDYTRLASAISGRRVSEKQLEQIIKVLSHSRACLTGGPGTGKSTCAQIIVDYYRDQLSLCAPTAMAAKRLSYCTGQATSTVHRLLEYKRGQFGINAENRLSSPGVLADEWSMADVQTGWALAQAMPDDAIFVAMGDANQLPSVGPGELFRDMCGLVTTGTLLEIFRTDADGPIGMFCDDVLNGRELRSYANDSGSEFKLIDVQGGATPKHLIEQIELACIATGCEPHEVRIASPFNRTVYRVNRIMAEKFPNRVPIVQKRNDYENEIWNGQTGYLVDPDIEYLDAFIKGDVDVAPMVNFCGLIVPFTSWCMDLGYCLTVHALQGDEAPAVIGVFPAQSAHHLNRRLIYTFASRPKQWCCILGDTGSVAHAVAKEQRTRNTLIRKIYKELVTVNH